MIFHTPIFLSLFNPFFYTIFVFSNFCNLFSPSLKYSQIQNLKLKQIQMARKRVEAEAAGPTESGTTNSLVRAKDGSAFARCQECRKDVPVALISMHNRSLEARIKMNLGAQVVETPTEVKKKNIERKKPTSTAPKVKKAKKEKSNDPNKPKRPPTAFFIFMDDFRKTFKEANPDSKDVRRAAKEGGEKWKSMIDEEKKQYLDKASKLKEEYKKALEINNAENEDDEKVSEKYAADEVEVMDAAADEVEDRSDEE